MKLLIDLAAAITTVAVALFYSVLFGAALGLAAGSAMAAAWYIEQLFK